MFRTAAVAKPRHIPAARELPIPAPVGGLNALDSITDMPPTDALVLENFFPQPDFVELRRGYSSHATGLGAAVDSLVEWVGPSTRKLFGAISSAVYEVSSSGAVGAAEFSSQTNGRWQHVQQGTSGGFYLSMVNGADAYRTYDGSSWATPTITGVSSSSLSNIWLFKERLFFVESSTLSAWYLPVNAVSGTVSEFPLYSVFKKGGKLVAGASMTRDGGAGPDDFCVFLTDRGEAAIYQGTDPSDASAWSIVGVFDLPPPIGNRCFQKSGGDLAVITEGGVISLNAMLVLDRAAQERAAVTSKINRLFATDARLYRGNFGWQVLSYPRSNMFIVNIPESAGGTQHQYVMNALTGAWCKFTGLNANCWSLFSEDLYFGGNNGTVWKADNTQQDNGGGITANLKTAFSDLGMRGRVKTAQMLRALYSTNGSPGVLMDINVDYADVEPTSSPSSGPAPGSLWDAATWDTDTWETGEVLQADWVGAAGIGHSMAVRLRVVSDGVTYTLNGFDMMATSGGLI